MWLAGSDPAQAYLGQSHAGIRRVVAGTSEADHWIACESVSDGWQGIVDALPASGATGVHVWLSGALARPFLFAAVEGVKRWGEAAEIAASLAPESTGLAGPCVVWMDGWRPGRTCAAVAMQKDILDEIEKVAKQRRIRLKGLRPWWAAVLDSVAAFPKQECRMLSVADTDSLTILSGNDEGMTSLSTYAPAPPHEQEQAVLARRLLGANLDASQLVKARITQADRIPGADVSVAEDVPFAIWTTGRSQ